MANRHLARSSVLQTLFEWDFRNYPDSEFLSALDRNLSEFAPGMNDPTFARHLASDILKKRKDIDTILMKAAPDWPLQKISLIDRNILRIGLYELLFSDRKEVPAKVAINEAIELAKTYGGDNSGRFVNGVLGTVYKELGEPGKDESSHKHKIDPAKLPVERLGGALVYARHENDVFIALVHDIFGHWTLSKGHLTEGEEDAAGTARVVKEEIGVNLTTKDCLGRNEYLASQPEKGKVRKQVIYYLAEAPFDDLKLAKSGGLDDARWFRLRDILDLNFYNDILPIVTKGVNILLKNK